MPLSATLPGSPMTELTDVHPVSLGLRPVRLREHSADRHILNTLLTHYPHLPPRPLPPRPLILDLGAHIGISAIELIGRSDDARLIAYEPHPASFALTQHNLASALEPMRSEVLVRVLPQAIWHEPARLSLGGPEAGACRVYQTGTQNDPSTPEHAVVDAITMTSVVTHALDTFAPTRGIVDYVKIDINGSEGMVFESDLSWLTRVGCVSVRVYAPSDRDRVAHQLEAAGLQVQAVRPRPDAPAMMLHAVSRRCASRPVAYPRPAAEIASPPRPI
jgi:FkbM family methyltransferase